MRILMRYHSPTYAYVPDVPPGKNLANLPGTPGTSKSASLPAGSDSPIKTETQCFCLLIVGNGELYHELVSLSTELGITDMVHFPGDRSDVPELLKKSDILVLPYVQDNQPFSIMEAQVAGKVVLASTAGGIPEMVTHNKTEFIFASKNSNDLADKLDFVLSNPELRMQVAEQGQKWGLQQWSPQSLMKRTYDMYMAALQS